MQMTKYKAWISENYPSYESAYGNCADATSEMIAEFPELRRVSGFYYAALWGRREHFWCISPDGEVIDPTAVQFPCKGNGAYEEVTDPSLIPTGRCLDCGEDVYNSKTFCDLQCENLTRKYLGLPILKESAPEVTA